MADNFIEINQATEKETEAPLFQVAVVCIINAEGDQRATSMPLHQVPLEMERQERESNSVRVLSEFTGSLKQYRQRRMSLAAIESEEARLREDYAYYDGETKVDVFTKIYGDPANCRFIDTLQRICAWWVKMMAREETITDDEIHNFALTLLPQKASPGTIPYMPMPGEEIEADVETDEAETKADEEPKKSGKKAGRPKKPAAANPDKTADPDALGQTAIDVELLDHLKGTFTNEDTALGLARLATANGFELTDEQLANVPGLDATPKYERARDALKAFKK